MMRIALAAGIALIFATSVYAEDAEVYVDYRQGLMSAVGGNTAASAAILIDGAPFEANLEEHARAIERLTEDIPALFPEGTDHEDSDAKPEVWDDRSTFEERAEASHRAATAFREAVEEGDPAQAMPYFRELGGSCSNCHDDFRVEE
ncbi:cytochrome c [Aquisalimonas sp.]|uniref:c-type cytochrome n=1 Tax=Aquisalimonas sp. TaxID=1872621 RepID=UPI0025C7094A|nr:cytochrome c [Aquisalimonas sp.]